MDRRKGTSLLDLPRWWWGIPIAGLAYVVFAFVIPAIAAVPEDGTGLGVSVRVFITTTSRALAPWAPFLFLLYWATQIKVAMRNSKRLDRQTGIDSIRQLSWQEFEDLLGEAYRRRGYRVEKTRFGADGGVDLVLNGEEGRLLVQAKQWRVRKVGVEKVRELLGVATAERANGAVLVTSGNASAAAKEFAERNGIQIVEGEQLVEMIREVQPAWAGRSALTTQSGPPPCPSCQSSMVRRVARQGPRKGQPFWGCSRYPDCRGIVDYPR